MAHEVLAECIPSRAYDVHMLLCNMVRLLYNKSLQSLGWSAADVSALENWTWAHTVAAEEFYGLHICTVQIITPVKDLSEQFAFTSNKPTMLRELRGHLEKEKTSGYFYEDTS